MKIWNTSFLLLMSLAYFNEAQVLTITASTAALAALGGALAIGKGLAIGGALGSGLRGRRRGRGRRRNFRRRFGRDVTKVPDEEDVNEVEDLLYSSILLDVEDCAKKLICLSSAEDQLKDLTNDEKTLSGMIGNFSPDSELAEFELAADIGRFQGSEQCNKVFRQCGKGLKQLTEELTQNVKTLSSN